MLSRAMDDLGLIPSADQTKQVAVVLSFMFAVRLVRWTVQTYQTNDFDTEVDFEGEGYNEMLEKCKFCQIITNGESLSYSDD